MTSSNGPPAAPRFDVSHQTRRFPDDSQSAASQVAELAVKDRSNNAWPIVGCRAVQVRALAEQKRRSFVEQQGAILLVRLEIG